MFLLVYSALLIGQIISSAFAAPNTLTQGIPTITRSTTVTAGEEGVQATNTNIPIIVSVVTSISTVPAPVVIQINPNAPSPAPPQKTITEVVEPVNSALSPAGAQSVIKSTKTPVNFTDNFSTWYQWDHNDRKEKMGDRDGGNQDLLIEVPSGWTPPAGFPTALTKYGRIGKRDKRDVETADIPTSFRTLTVFGPAVVVTASNPAPPPPRGPQLLPGQIPTTRSDLDGIAVGQGHWEPGHISELHIFSWDADHPEYVAIGGKYANLVSTLVKHAPSLAPAPAEPTPQQQQPQQQQQQQGPITITLPGKTTEQVVMTFVTNITKVYESAVVMSESESETRPGSGSASVVQHAPAPAPAPSSSTSLVTIPAGQLGGINKEATLLSVLVPVAKSPAAAAAAPVVPASASTAAVVPAAPGPQVISTSFRTLSLVANTPAAAAAVTEPAPGSNSASGSASGSNGPQAQPHKEKKEKEEKKEEKKEEEKKKTGNT